MSGDPFKRTSFHYLEGYYPGSNPYDSQDPPCIPKIEEPNLLGRAQKHECRVLKASPSVPILFPEDEKENNKYNAQYDDNTKFVSSNSREIKEIEDIEENEDDEEIEEEEQEE